MLRLMAACVLTACMGLAQTFDVVSVKALEQDGIETVPHRAGGRITWTTDLFYLIGYAYRLQPSRVTGHIPDSRFAYRVEATTAADTSDDKVRVMFQSLLKDRFRIVSHWGQTTKTCMY